MVSIIGMLAQKKLTMCVDLACDKSELHSSRQFPRAQERVLNRHRDLHQQNSNDEHNRVGIVYIILMWSGPMVD
jgi:hypothetical protein